MPYLALSWESLLCPALSQELGIVIKLLVFPLPLYSNALITALYFRYSLNTCQLPASTKVVP